MNPTSTAPNPAGTDPISERPPNELETTTPAIAARQTEAANLLRSTPEQTAAPTVPGGEAQPAHTTKAARTLHTFVVANQKGGVGKTTTTVNLAAALARQGKRVLLVDLDPQGNATMGSGIDKRALVRSVYHVLIGMSDVIETRQHSTIGGYDVLPANRELAGAEIELVDFDERETRLKHALTSVEQEYDFVLVDCPPSLSLLTLNGFCAAHGVIIPMQCEYFALEGLTDLVNTIKRIHKSFNTNLRIIGLLRVMFDPRMTLSMQVSKQLTEHFGDKVFNAIIPRNVRLAEAPSYGQPGVVFDPNAKGAKAYLEFGAELTARINRL